jgi:lipoprotein-releasing system ATP-binding protein
MTAILKIIDLCKTYEMGRSQNLHVLKGINLEIQEGEIIAVIGPSGVGKTTLLQIVGALDRPTSGQVEIDGANIFKHDHRRMSIIRNKTVGFIYQFHHLLPEFSAIENLMIPALIGGQKKAAIKNRAMELLKMVGLQDRALHRPAEMSGGEQQRIAVARALMNSPRLLLADEPSGNLDMQTAQSLHDLLWRLSREHNQTLIIVTHNHDLAQQADRIVELYDGQVKHQMKNPPD